MSSFAIVLGLLSSLLWLTTFIAQGYAGVVKTCWLALGLIALAGGLAWSGPG